MKESKRTYGIFIEPSKLKVVKAEAKKKRRSLSAQLTWIVDQWIERKTDEERGQK